VRGQRLQLSAGLDYDVIYLDDPPPEAEGPYKVATRRYRYHVLTDDMREVLLWHWHPDSSSTMHDPHVHLGTTQLAPTAVINKRVHVATSRVAFEQVLLTTIDLGVTPLRDDWASTLNESLAAFARWRTW
jgi:hypothetical protein